MALEEDRNRMLCKLTLTQQYKLDEKQTQETAQETALYLTVNLCDLSAD